MPHDSAQTFLFLALLMLASKLGAFVEKARQPAVFGEILAGIALAALAYMGQGWVDQIRQDTVLAFLAELGVVVLLFQIGLESNLKEMARVGWRSLFVASIGVIAPFGMGLYLSPYLFPELPVAGQLFFSAALTATSVGISARVFQELGILDTPAARTVLGAAVLDDILGLLLLAIVAGLVQVGTVEPMAVAMVGTKAIVFLVAAIGLGGLAAPYLGAFFSRIHTGHGMKFSVALAFALFFAYLASLAGLAPIVGAFAAGLVLDSVHFKAFQDADLIVDLRRTTTHILDSRVKEQVEGVMERHSRRHVEDFVQYLGHFLVPLFFVHTGLQVDFKTLANPATFGLASIVVLIAVTGKIIAGLAAEKGQRLFVGLGMVPRGEVGIIFATVGRQMGVISDDLFSILVLVALATTLITPPLLLFFLTRGK